MKSTWPHTGKAFALFLAIGMILSACESDLWGTYATDLTPTSASSAATRENPKSIATPTWTPTIPPLAQITTEQVPNSAEPTSTPTVLQSTSLPGKIIFYTSQSGDSLSVVASHFGLQVSDISSQMALPASGFINPGTLLFLPENAIQASSGPSQRIIPDSELVDSPSAVGFDIQAYVDSSGGRLSTYTEWMAGVGTITGAQGIDKISLGSSISPRLLLALIQSYTGWVRGGSRPGLDEKYLFGYENPANTTLYQQMRLVIQDLLTGYYGWRAGTLHELKFPDGTSLRIAPDLNAGTVALQYFFSKHYNYAEWLQAINPDTGFLALYKSMFGDPWERANELGPLFPPNLIQPPFSLPFEVGVPWTFISGPHPAWESESAWGALDFAPPADVQGCFESTDWVVAVATGQIVRSENSYVVLDLDGDGFEQTGWVMIYQHIAAKGRLPAGTRVNAGERIGHPSCDGGTATGTHVHIARKYNGEWVAAGGPLPFNLSGWTVIGGEAPYKGSLTKGDKIVTASLVSERTSQIIRQPDE